MKDKEIKTLKTFIIELANEIYIIKNRLDQIENRLDQIENNKRLEK